MIEGADAFIKLDKKIQFTFLSNNSQRTRLAFVEKLEKLGISVTEEHIYNSAMATRTFGGLSN